MSSGRYSHTFKIRTVYWPTRTEGYWINIDRFLFDLDLASEWSAPPWVISGREDETYREFYYQLIGLKSEVDFELERKEAKSSSSGGDYEIIERH